MCDYEARGVGGNQLMTWRNAEGYCQVVLSFLTVKVCEYRRYSNASRAISAASLVSSLTTSLSQLTRVALFVTKLTQQKCGSF